MSVQVFVPVAERFPNGHLFVRPAFSMDGCYTAPWWAAPFIRARYVMWGWLMTRFCSRTRYERALRTMWIEGYCAGEARAEGRKHDKNMESMLAEVLGHGE